jgi:hypothetical protein
MHSTELRLQAMMHSAEFFATFFVLTPRSDAQHGVVVYFTNVSLYIEF